jgi:hypothetical protein
VFARTDRHQDQRKGHRKQAPRIGVSNTSFAFSTFNAANTSLSVYPSLAPETTVFANNNNMNVALYGRVFTKDKGQNAENQLAQLRTFAATQGWTVAHEYVDRVSGKHSDREQFQRLFRDASQWKFDLVLFWSLDIHDDFAILAPFQVHRVVTPPFFIKQEYPGTHRKRHPLQIQSR